MRSLRRFYWLPVPIILLAAAAWYYLAARPVTHTTSPTPSFLATLASPQVTIIRPSQTPSTTPISPETPTFEDPLPAPLQSSPQPTASPTPANPKDHFIQAITGHHQFFPLGCETAAAKDWANYFHKDFNEFEFQYKLPASDNPDFGFVGDVNSPWGQIPPYGYGVYAGPIAALLNTYGIPAKAYKGYTLDQLKNEIAQDRPAIVWVIGNVVGGVPYTYTDKQGNKVIVAAYEHVVIVTGYDDSHIRYMNNGRFYDTPTKVFLNSWAVLGNMAVVTP